MKRSIIGLLSLFVFAACSGDTPAPTAVGSGLTASLDDVPGKPLIGHFKVCKEYRGAVGPDATVNWTMTRPYGDDLRGVVTLGDGECATVYHYNETGSLNGTEKQTVTVTEVPVFGYTTSLVLTSHLDFNGDPIIGNEVPGNEASGAVQGNPDTGFSVTFFNTEIPSADGRMTGGGSAFTSDNVRITHGFELHCDLSEPNRLQVNWEGNRFHMTELLSARCTDNPAFDEGQPKAGFDTFDGIGVGRYNGVDGFDITFQFVDDGEPGTSDIDRIVITDPSNGDAVVMSVGNFLDRGNHQAHK